MPLFLAALLLLIAASVMGCQTAAPSAAGCSAARAFPSCSAAAVTAGADPGQDNSL